MAVWLGKHALNRSRFSGIAAADTGIAMLKHDSHEGGVVLAGELEITVGDQIKVLKPGDAYLFDSRIPHRYRNIGTERCIVVSACTPPYL